MVQQAFQLLAADTLQAVYPHFPEPHMRQRFRKRRVVSPGFLDEINRALAPGGLLSITTDHHEFVMEMLDVVEQDVRFTKTHAERYLIGFEAPAKPQFQRMCERDGLPTLRVELQKARCPPSCLQAPEDSGQQNTVLIDVGRV
jgi:tRNA (guanine-N7-)-methyltransferase